MNVFVDNSLKYRFSSPRMASIKLNPWKQKVGRSFHNLLSKDFASEITFLGPNFRDGMKITLDKADSLVTNKVLQKVSVSVSPTVKPFAFAVNGFEFHNYEKNSLGKATIDLSDGPTEWAKIKKETLDSHARAIEKVLVNWGKKQNFLFRDVICIDSVLRNTIAGRFGAVHFAHVDFPSGDTAATLAGHKNWKDRIVDRLGPMSFDAYTNLKIARIVNVWMPLDPKLEAYPLAVMDTQTLGIPRQHLRIYQDERINGGDKYHSVGVMPHRDQRWYIKKDMRLGEAIIFDSCLTPHSAVRFPDQGEKSRKSIECRAIFIL